MDKVGSSTNVNKLLPHSTHFGARGMPLLQGEERCSLDSLTPMYPASPNFV